VAGIADARGKTGITSDAQSVLRSKPAHQSLITDVYSLASSCAHPSMSNSEISARLCTPRPLKTDIRASARGRWPSFGAGRQDFWLIAQGRSSLIRLAG
jgi:hypothetical protein